MISKEQRAEIRTQLRNKRWDFNPLPVFYGWETADRWIESYTHDLCHWHLLKADPPTCLVKHFVETVAATVKELPEAERDQNEIDTIALEAHVLRGQIPSYDRECLLVAGHRNLSDVYSMSRSKFDTYVEQAERQPRVRAAVRRVRASLQALIPGSEISWRRSRAKGAQ